MKFLGVNIKVVDKTDFEENLYWTLIQSTTIEKEFHQYANSLKDAIERTKKIVLMDGDYIPRWKKSGVGSGYNYYLDEAPYHFSIKKIKKKQWEFFAFENNGSAYTFKSITIICTSLTEAKQKVFKAYELMCHKI